MPYPSQNSKNRSSAKTKAKLMFTPRSRDVNTTAHGSKVCFASFLFVIIMSAIFYLGRLNSNRFYDMMLTVKSVKNITTNNLPNVDKGPPSHLVHAPSKPLKRG